jgi:hypothetical protein
VVCVWPNADVGCPNAEVVASAGGWPKLGWPKADFPKVEVDAEVDPNALVPLDDGNDVPPKTEVAGALALNADGFDAVPPPNTEVLELLPNAEVA